MRLISHNTEIKSTENDEKIKHIDDAISTLIKQSNAARLFNLDVKTSFTEQFLMSVNDYLK